jgi:hypothetical protein
VTTCGVSNGAKPTADISRAHGVGNSIGIGSAAIESARLGMHENG